jgi:hypothetical protein
MADLFSQEWMTSFMEQWNAEPELSDALEKINFSTTIGYGFDNEDNPSGVLVIKNGKAVAAGTFNGETLNWDLRASKESWGKWATKPPGMMGLGTAYTTRKLKFKIGDYAAMIKDPRMAGPFIKSFAVMGRA